MILHAFYKRFNRLATEIARSRSHWREGVRLIDEQDPTECLPNGATGLRGSVTYVLPDKPGTVNLDEVADLQ
jgi:hypothetical protein